MSYLPLARKYRPATFQELVGQNSVSLALTNAIKLGREPHAVVFAGVRGIGKTTTARLYAKALNCESGPTPAPCGQCISCKAIEEGRHEDVLEIDGASHTSVDDVRVLREMVQYVPQRSRYKIFIVDEVHMLSQSAFNALLKTLEEPPDAVVFIFATTELQKIPQTILSRCQVFHLKRFALEEIEQRLTAILQAEGLKFEAAAVAWVAKRGRGSMRDALTALDQVIALGNGEVTNLSITSVLGGVSATAYTDLIMAVVGKNGEAILRFTEELEAAGASYEEACEELAGLCRHAMIIRELGVKSLDIGMLGLDAGMLQALQQIAAAAGALDLNRIFRFLVKLRSELDGSRLDRYVFENYMLEWCFDPGIPTLDDWQNQLGATSPAVNAPAPTPTATAPQPTAAPRERRVPNLRKGLFNEVNERTSSEKESLVVNALVNESVVKTFPESWRELVDRWKQSKPLQARILEEAYLIHYSADEISLGVNENSMAAGKLLQPQVQAKVRDAFRELFGFKGQLKIVPQASDQETLLDIKNREKEAERRQIADQAQNDPFTQLVLETFNAKIDEVIVEN